MPMAKVVLPNATEYCNRHGYEFNFVWYPEPCNPDFGYNKLIKIKELFSKGIDVVFSLDLDVLITNHNINVTDFLDDDYDFFVTKDVNGVNCGSFIIRNTKWSNDFINLLLKKRGEPGMHCEQDALRAYMEEYQITPIKILKHPSINSYLYQNYLEFGEQKHEDGQWREGDFILHVPGLGTERRLEILSTTKIIK